MPHDSNVGKVLFSTDLPSKTKGCLNNNELQPDITCKVCPLKPVLYDCLGSRVSFGLTPPMEGWLLSSLPQGGAPADATSQRSLVRRSGGPRRLPLHQSFKDFPTNHFAFREWRCSLLGAAGLGQSHRKNMFTLSSARPCSVQHFRTAFVT